MAGCRYFHGGGTGVSTDSVKELRILLCEWRHKARVKRSRPSRSCRASSWTVTSWRVGFWKLLSEFAALLDGVLPRLWARRHPKQGALQARRYVTSTDRILMNWRHVLWRQ